MTETEDPLGERVAAVETDIKHVWEGIVRIEGSVARIEDVVVKEVTSRLEIAIARVDCPSQRRRTSSSPTSLASEEHAETWEEFQ